MARRGRRLSFMIAAGIGLHNVSEGLAIGRTYAQGAAGLIGGGPTFAGTLLGKGSATVCSLPAQTLPVRRA